LKSFSEIVFLTEPITEEGMESYVLALLVAKLLEDRQLRQGSAERF
jgi:hypothetical protein